MSDIQMLLDERDIIRGLSNFARILDSKRWDDLSLVFADDVLFNYGAVGEHSGMAALRANMQRFLDRCGPTQHLLGSILVDVDSDTAVSRSYVQARHQRVEDPAGAIFDSNGEYVDRWARRPEGWRIVRRDAVWQMHSGDPAILAADDLDL